MLETINKSVKWFIEQTNTNKIAIILVAVLVVMFYDRKDFKEELNTLKNDKRTIDSIYVARLNRVTVDFQKKIDDCNNERIEDYLRQSKMWQEKFEELFKETDMIYQKYQQVIKDR